MDSFKSPTAKLSESGDDGAARGFQSLTASYCARYLLQDGNSNGKKSDLLFPLGFVVASKPFDHVRKRGYEPEALRLSCR